jgi:hypothetical protein
MASPRAGAAISSKENKHTRREDMAEPKVRNRDRMMGPLLALIVAVVLLAAIFYTQRDQERVRAGANSPAATDASEAGGANSPSTTADPSQMLEIAQVNIMPLENPAPGGQSATVTLQGEVMNRGDREAREILVEAQFYGKDGKLVHTQTEALVPVKTKDGAATEEGSFKDSPLKAGESRPFRIALGPVPTEWNREIPKMRIVQVVVP